jgi:ribosomal protein L12E/L44/L45/RPP1/RPP2
MDSRGNKPQLVARLEAAQAAMAAPAPAAAAAAAGVAAKEDGGSSSNSSEDELDRAEEKLAGNLSGVWFDHCEDG